MALYNVQRGRIPADFQGLEKLQSRVKSMMIFNSDLKDEVTSVINKAAVEAKMQVIASAMAANVPHDVLRDIFDFGRQRGDAGRRGQITSLVGMRKKGRAAKPGSTVNAAHAYRVWYPGRQLGKGEEFKKFRAPRGHRMVMPGAINDAGERQKIGENLGTMWEFGTTKMAPRPWFRRAIQAARAGILATILEGYRDIIERRAQS